MKLDNRVRLILVPGGTLYGRDRKQPPVGGCGFFLRFPASPLPSSKKSVMVAEVQRLQGLEASMEVRMEDMSRLSLFTPKRSSQNLESSWDKPRR